MTAMVPCAGQLFGDRLGAPAHELSIISLDRGLLRPDATHAASNGVDELRAKVGRRDDAMH